MEQIENKEQLEQQYPELTAQIRKEAAAEGRKQGAEQERSRIAGIDALAMQGFEDIIAAAKADPTKDAGTVAQEMILAQKNSGKTYLAAIQQDANDSGANGVAGAAAPAAKKTAEDDAGADMAAAAKAAVKDWMNGGETAGEEGAKQ